MKCPYCGKEFFAEDGVKSIKCEKCFARVTIEAEKPTKNKTASNEAKE